MVGQELSNAAWCPEKWGIWPTAEQGVFRLCFAEGSSEADGKGAVKRLQPLEALLQ